MIHQLFILIKRQILFTEQHPSLFNDVVSAADYIQCLMTLTFVD